LLNFSFWLDGTPGRSFAVTWQGEQYRGYFALCACINRALAVRRQPSSIMSVLLGSLWARGGRRVSR
jgi:hypothetical protein